MIKEFFRGITEDSSGNPDETFPDFLNVNDLFFDDTDYNLLSNNTTNIAR